MKKILVGVDLSSGSERAVAHAIDLARHAGAEAVLVLVDVMPEVPADVAPALRATAETYARTLAERLAADRRELAAMRERWAGHGATLSQIIVDGYADERLIAVAKEIGAELIVVGSHGRTGLERFLLGSVAERVVRLADHSVLVARGNPPSGGYRRVVLGTDFSTLSDQATLRALELIASGARIDLVHGWTVPWMAPIEGAVVPLPYAQMQEDLEETLATMAEAMRDHLRDAGRGDVKVESRVVQGPASQALINRAVDAKADLIVVGSHGRRGLRRFILGSVAETTIRHAPCSVLVAR